MCPCICMNSCVAPVCSARSTYIHLRAGRFGFPPLRPTVGISASVSHPKLRFLTCFSIASQSGSGVTRPHSSNTHNAKVQTVNLAKQQNLIRFVQQSHESKASVILCVMNGRCCASVPDVCMCRCLPPPTLSQHLLPFWHCFAAARALVPTTAASRRGVHAHGVGSCCKVDRIFNSHLFFSYPD